MTLVPEQPAPAEPAGVVKPYTEAETRGFAKCLTCADYSEDPGCFYKEPCESCFLDDARPKWRKPAEPAREAERPPKPDQWGRRHGTAPPHEPAGEASPPAADTATTEGGDDYATRDGDARGGSLPEVRADVTSEASDDSTTGASETPSVLVVCPECGRATDPMRCVQTVAGLMCTSCRTRLGVSLDSSAPGDAERMCKNCTDFEPDDGPDPIGGMCKRDGSFPGRGSCCADWNPRPAPPPAEAEGECPPRGLDAICARLDYIALVGGSTWAERKQAARDAEDIRQATAAYQKASVEYLVACTERDSLRGELDAWKQNSNIWQAAAENKDREQAAELAALAEQNGELVGERNAAREELAAEKVRAEQAEARALAAEGKQVGLTTICPDCSRQLGARCIHGYALRTEGGEGRAPEPEEAKGDETDNPTGD